jgi:flagellar biosynthesis protein FliR
MNVQGLIDFAPIFLRCFGLMTLMPLGDSTAVHWRIGLAAGLAMFISGSVPTNPDWSMISLLAEFIVGLFLALPAALTISLSASFGELFDTQRGQMMGSSMIRSQAKLAPQAQCFFLI